MIIVTGGAGYDKPFKTVAEGVTEYMAWLNRDA